MATRTGATGSSTTSGGPAASTSAGSGRSTNGRRRGCSGGNRFERRAQALALDRTSAALAVLLQQAPADDGLLDLGGTLADQQERRLPHEPPDLVLLGVAVPAVDAERLLHHLDAVLAGEQLRHAGLDVVALPGVLEPGGVHHQRVCRLDLCGHLG